MNEENGAPVKISGTNLMPGVRGRGDTREMTVAEIKDRAIKKIHGETRLKEMNKKKVDKAVKKVASKQD